ncbi:hypothetical protein [Paenibacillus dendritiformis]|uniref:hypothetical protein n=1 Tax=Paenibacillus dendritiformis TaxID=130049 RepID=UPI0030B89AA2
MSYQYQPYPMNVHPGSHIHPYSSSQFCPHYYPETQNLKIETLQIVEPWVINGLKEAQTISVEHALREAAAVSYLIGRGYNPAVAHQIVESWWHKG